MELTRLMVSEKIKKGALILDVRTSDEYSAGFYPGAINIPLSALPSNLDKLKPKSRSILTYCASGTRGSMAAAMLNAYGWIDVHCAGSLTDMPKQ